MAEQQDRPGSQKLFLSPTAGTAGAEAAEEILLPPFTYPPGSCPLAGYTIKRAIGHGGFGEVYYATSDIGKEVALKLIRRNLQIELRGLRQCLNLKHPNLVDIYDIRQDAQGNYWVIMEYVTGPSLQERIRACPSGLPLEEIAHWMRGIMGGVAYLHEHGLVHRDLKPANIFWEQGLVKIGDYGLSKYIVANQRSGQTEQVGTVYYMAPEIAQGRYGHEIDIYALGVILYEMLTGRVPFQGETAGEILMKHLTARPDLSLLPEVYRPVVAGALEKDPSKRFTSVGEMWERLEPIVSLCSSNLSPPLWKPIARPTPPSTQGIQGRGLLDPGAFPGPSPSQIPLPQSTPPAARGQAVGSFRRLLRPLWQPANLRTLFQFLVVAGMLFGVLAMDQLLVPLAALGMMGYGLYGLGRKIGVPLSQWAGGSRGAGGTDPVLLRPETKPGVWPPSLPGAQKSPYEQAAETLRNKPLLLRITELLGSWIVGAVTTVLMTGGVVLFYSLRQGGQIFPPEQIVWVVVMSMTGTWAVLTVAKFWEGRQGEPLLRRLVLLLVGLGLGALAYGVSQWLWVEWESLEHLPRAPLPPWPFQLHGPGGEPLLLAFLVNFALLFALIRWWRQADPLRFARLNLWSVFVCVLGAALVAAVFRFPQPWLPMTGGLISFSIQLAAPWAHPRRRHLR